MREEDNEPRSGKDTLPEGMDETSSQTVVRRDRGATPRPDRATLRFITPIRVQPIKVVTTTAHRRSDEKPRSAPAAQVGCGRLPDSVPKATDRLVSRSINPAQAPKANRSLSPSPRAILATDGPGAPNHGQCATGAHGRPTSRDIRSSSVLFPHSGRAAGIPLAGYVRRDGVRPRLVSLPLSRCGAHT